MNRTEKMNRIAKLIAANPSIHFSGFFNRLGHELIAWEGRDGIMVGEFKYMEFGPFLPSLYSKVLCSTWVEAMVVLRELAQEDEWSPRTLGDLSTAE